MRLGVRDLYVQCRRNQSILIRMNKQNVAISAGIIRGALMRLGLHGTVTPEINLPQCASLMGPAELSAKGQRRYIPSENTKIAMKDPHG